MKKFTEDKFQDMIEEKAVDILTDAIDSGCQPRCDYTDYVAVEDCLLDDLVDEGTVTEEEAEHISMREYWK